MRKIQIYYGLGCTVIFPATATMVETCNFINELPFFKQSLMEIENPSFRLDNLNLNDEKLITGDNGIITIKYSIENKLIVINN